MNYCDYLFYDFETGSANPHRCQPIQLACVPIHGRKLEIIEDTFCSLIQPVFNLEECDKYNLDPISDEALEINKIKREDLEKAPPLKLVWSQFGDFINQYNYKKTKWTAPVKCGYNNTRFDDVIIDRIAGGQNRHLQIISNDLKTNINNLVSEIRSSKDEDSQGNHVPVYENDNLVMELCKLSKKIFRENEPYKFGPWDGECTLFHPRDSIDLMKIMFWFTENIGEVRSLSMDSMREWLGLTSDGAHSADVDVLQGAQILTRFLRYTRKCSTAAKFKGAFK